eukprot:TRINITY_DN36826_c0_g2_i5.p1 TRINITY_DN36826_c0_g2~~TRINITY_DN36826_c0_g2_i5.p1  ORF type:complete len:247 (+),score=53.42 TRINITY_DN36826_c0_g2_i5:58-798(+)
MLPCHRFQAASLFLVFSALRHTAAWDTEYTTKAGGKAAADKAWRLLERTAAPGVKQDDVDWLAIHEELQSAHPDADASGALAWLYLFGVPDESGSLALPGGFPRDVDRAVKVAREAVLQSPTCGRCHALLGLLCSLGYPPLVNVVHTTAAAAALSGGSSRRPSQVVLGSELHAWPPASLEAAKLPHDVGPVDPAAAAYQLAAKAGDALGLLANAYLEREGLIDSATLQALPTQAPFLRPAVVHRSS